MRPRRFVYASVVLILLGSLAARAGTNYHALVIRSVEPLDYVLIEKFKINGKDKLYRLDSEAPLTRGQYRRLPKLSFSEVDSLRVAGGRLQVRTNSGVEVLALPQNFKSWPKGSLQVDAIVKGSKLKGKRLDTKQSFSAALGESWIFYLFPGAPQDDTLAFSLTEAQNTETAWVEFLRRFPGSPHARVPRQVLADLYLQRATRALRQFQEALREKKPGYGFLGEARRWLDQLRSLNLDHPAQAEAQATLTRLEADIDQRLRQARLLAEEADFEAAEQTLEPVLHFRHEFADLAAAHEDITLQAARYHLEQARQRLSRAEFDEAVRELEAAASYRELPEASGLAQEIEQQRQTYQRQQEIQQVLAQARAAMARKDYASAFDLLWPVALRFSDDRGLQREFSSVQRAYRAALLAEVSRIERLHTPLRGPADEEVVARLHRDLTRLNQMESIPSLVVWRDRMSLHLADYYRQRAKQLAERDDADLDTLAFAYLQQSQRFLLNKAELREFTAHRRQLEDALRIRLALNFRDLTPAASGEYVVAELAALMASSIQNAGFPHVDIMEVRRGESPQLTLELIVELLQAAVRDAETSQPVASEYSAGFRQAPNPEWREAKTAYEQAVEEYERVRTRVEQNRRQKKYEKKDRQADDEALAGAEDSLKKAGNALDAVPAFIEQEDVRPYEFTRRNRTRTAEIRLSYRWVNALTGVREAQEILEERSSESAEEVAGVHPADKQGHRNQPPNLPEAAALRGRVLRKIQQALAERALQYLDALVALDFERGQREAQRGNKEVAAEHYLRFLFNSPGDAPQRRQAVEYLGREFRLASLSDWLPVADVE